MNYIFIKPYTGYPILYRHDVYGKDLPDYKLAVYWTFIYEGERLDRPETHVLLTVI